MLIFEALKNYETLKHISNNITIPAIGGLSLGLTEVVSNAGAGSGNSVETIVHALVQIATLVASVYFQIQVLKINKRNRNQKKKEDLNNEDN